MAPPDGRLPADVAGRYRIERELGRGGMAIVFLATDLRHHRPVAVKVVHPEIAAHLGQERFLREIRTLARLTHPHILPLYDSGEAEGILYYVMPYVEGESLRDRLSLERQLPVEDAVRIAGEVAGALEYAHRHAVVHRDVKPENILLEEGHAVVADFGIAKAVDVAGDEQITSRGMILGSPAYMSPEQTLGDIAVDGRADIYSLGCVLYEMLAGQPPFSGPTADSVARQHLSLDPPPITAMRPGVGVEISGVAQRALAKSPADRFATAAEFARALETATAVRSLGIAAAVTARTPRARGERRRWIAWTAGCVVGVLVAAVLLYPRSRQLMLWPFRHATGPPSLAVLYFQNFGASRDDDYLAAGVTEDVTTSLSQIAGLRVASRTAVERFRGRPVAPRDVGNALEVGYLLEGSIRRAGDNLRVTAQLIRTGDGFHMWAGKYDGTLRDIFAVQDTIASRITGALQVALAPDERATVLRRWTENPDAYAAHLTGREIYFDAGRPAAATEARPWFEKALDLDQNYAPALAALADVLVTEWDQGIRAPKALDRATELAQKAERLDPSLAIAWRAEARASLERGDRGRARELLERAVAANRHVRESYGVLATVYSDLGQRDRAREMIRRFVEVDPDWPVAYLQGAPKYLVWGDYASADRLVAAGVARLPHEPLLQVARAQVLEARGRLPEAIDVLLATVRADPDCYLAQVRLVALLRQSHRLTEADSASAWAASHWPNSPVVLSDKAWNELGNGRCAPADSLFERILAIEPHFLPARTGLIACYRRRNRTGEADRATLALAKLWPDDPGICETIARLNYDLGRFAAAEPWARRAVALSPKQPTAHDQLAWDCVQQGKYAPAVEEERAAVALHPGSALYHKNLANILIRVGKPRDAVEAARDALAIDPYFVDAIRALGNAYNNMGNTFQAAAQYENCLAIKPDDIGAINNLAIVYTRQERYEKAADMYRRATSLDTANALPWLNLSDLELRELRDRDAARQAARKCIGLAPGTVFEASGLLILGLAEALDGRPAAAREFYAQGKTRVDLLLQVNSSDPDVIGLAGMLCAQLGDVRRAHVYGEKLASRAGASPDELYAAASVMAVAGDRDRAVDYLRRAVAAGFDDKGLLKLDFDLDALRADTRFKELLANLK